MIKQDAQLLIRGDYMAGRRSNGEGSISYDKRRNRYRVKVTVGWELNEETGRTKQIVKSLGSNFKTKGEASRALAEYLESNFNLDEKDITFAELYEKWFKDRIEDKSSMGYRVKGAYKYCSILYNKKFRDLSILDMKKCINEGSTIVTRGKYRGETRTTSPQVKQTIKYIFNNMYAYAIEGRIINHNYAKDFTLEKSVFTQQAMEHKSKIPFSEDNINKLWQSIEFVPFADMVLFGCYSGWRPGELIKLKIEDVDLDNECITGGIKTINGKNRTVPIHPLVKDIVIKYYNEAKEAGSEYLFNDVTKKQGIGLSRDQYLSRFNKIMEILKFNKIYTPHCTRHTFITKAKNVGMNEYILKRIVGHKINDLTEKVYTHRTLDDLKREMLKIKS